MQVNGRFEAQTDGGRVSTKLTPKLNNRQKQPDAFAIFMQISIKKRKTFKLRYNRKLDQNGILDHSDHRPFGSISQSAANDEII